MDNFTSRFKRLSVNSRINGTRELRLSRMKSQLRLTPRLSPRENESLKNLRYEFFYNIFEWNPLWLGDKQFQNTSPADIDSILMNPTKLVYDSHQEYLKIMLPFLIHEFWFTLRKDFMENRKKRQKKVNVFLDADCYDVRSDRDDDSDPKIMDLTLSATLNFIINNRKIEDIFPSRGDLVSIQPLGSKSSQFGYVIEVDRCEIYDKRRSHHPNYGPPKTHLTYHVITKFTPKSSLSSRFELKTITWILSHLTVVDALGYINKSPLIESILKPDVASYEISPVLDDISTVTKERLNPRQSEVLSRIVSTIKTTTPGICLCQGPPGTGKSTVIKNIIASTLSQKQISTILLCAPSNKAIDELVMRLLAIQPAMRKQMIPFTIVRVGREEKIHEDVKCVSLSRLKSQYKDLNNSEPAEESILRSANIIACTLTSCYTSYWMKNVFGSYGEEIPICIIDEAAQATELLTLVPLLLNIDRLILVGDPQQLPPTILSQKAKSYGYDSSLFSRAQAIFENKSKNPIVMLDTQYRMVDSISQWPSRYFYKNAIKNEASVAPLNFCSYKVFNHSYPQKEDGHSNLNEAKLVVKILRMFIDKVESSHSDKEISIGIITPYQDQRKLINSLLNPPKVENLKEQKNKNQVRLQKKKNIDKDENFKENCKIVGKENNEGNTSKVNKDIESEETDSEKESSNDDNEIIKFENHDWPSKVEMLENKQVFDIKNHDEDQKKIDLKRIIKEEEIEETPEKIICEKESDEESIENYKQTEEVKTKKSTKDKKIENQKEQAQIFKPQRIQVNTVDSFQGSECDIIIMSCVRSEGIGFVKDPNRLNVSLTRAKHTLIMCGNFNTFRKNEMWNNLIEDAQSRGVYFNLTEENELQTIVKHVIIKPVEIGVKFPANI